MSSENLPWAPEDFRLVMGTTKIDYDLLKEEANREKHKYSLQSVVYFFERLLLPVSSNPLITVKKLDRDDGEVRYWFLGLDDQGIVVSFVITMRDNETVRVISFRPASHKEREIYWRESGL